MFTNTDYKQYLGSQLLVTGIRQNRITSDDINEINNTPSLMIPYYCNTDIIYIND